MPLYYWVNDEVPGDATGQNVNDVWFVVPSYTVGVGSNEELGDFLVGVNGMTLYRFANDEENVSNCYDQCAENWPPASPTWPRSRSTSLSFSIKAPLLWTVVPASSSNQ